MQLDFHHTVTYVLARLAGFLHQDAAIIAYSAQYVDDAQNKGTIRFDNDKTYDHIASSHSVYDVKNNLWQKEDHQVWVPFHFLPGNNGVEAGKLQDVPGYERLVCWPDSHVAADMTDAALATRGQLGSLHRLGITTHVYADTWAHQRFAGVMNAINVAHDETKEGLLDKIEAVAADVAGLGHGAVSVHPDQPFLIWKYRDSKGAEIQRNNPEIFIEACERIFQLHVAYRGGGGTQIQLQPQDRTLLYDSLRKFTSTDAATRHRKWLELLRVGGFSFGALTAQQIEELDYHPKGIGSWKYDALGTDAETDDADRRFPYKNSFETSNWKLFHEALKAHRDEVLYKLLPKFGLGA